MRKTPYLISLLSSLALLSCGTPELSSSLAPESSLEEPSISSQGPVSSSIESSRTEDTSPSLGASSLTPAQSSSDESVPSATSSEAASSTEPVPVSSSPSGEEDSASSSSILSSAEESSSTEAGPSFADVLSYAEQLDASSNFTLNSQKDIFYSIGTSETITEKDLVAGNEYLAQSGYSNVYSYIDAETGLNHSYYEDFPNKGIKDHRSYWGKPYYTTAYFISGYNYAYMTMSLSAILEDGEGTFAETQVEGETAYVSAIPIDLEFAREFYSKSDGYTFSYFVQAQYPDWALSHFTLLPTYEEGEIVSLKVTYEAKAIYAEYGNSGKVDYKIYDNQDFHWSFLFSDAGETTVVIPEGVPSHE